jgi:hypothetical protein
MKEDKKEGNDKNEDKKKNTGIHVDPVDYFHFKDINEDIKKGNENDQCIKESENTPKYGKSKKKKNTGIHVEEVKYYYSDLGKRSD